METNKKTTEKGTIKEEAKMTELWFEGTNGWYYSRTDVCMAAWMLSEKKLRTDADVIAYAETLPGLIGKPVDPTVEDFILAKMPTQAVRKYYYEHRDKDGITLKDAKNTVDEMKAEIEKMNNRK